MIDPEDGGTRRWRVGLAAHGSRREALARLAERHRGEFASWALVAPSATAEALAASRLPIARLPTGQGGGELALAAGIATGELDALILLRDPLAPGRDGREAEALIRLADVHNVAVATNLASAECLVRALAPEGLPAGGR